MNDKRRLFEARIAAGADSALIRFTLGRICAEEGDASAAISNLSRAVELDPDYSAAWALLGKVHANTDHRDEASTAYRTGIEVAERKGDLHTARQMKVLLKKLEKSAG